MYKIQFPNMAFNRMSAALSVLILRNFSKIFLRARQTLKFSHSLGHSRHSQLTPKSTFVRCWSNRRQNSVRSVCPLSANFSREPPFLLRELSYMRELPPKRADSPQERIGGVDGGGCYTKTQKP